MDFMQKMYYNATRPNKKETIPVETLEELRKRLDEIDNQIVNLYEQRMEVCAGVGEYKIQNGKRY